MNDRKSAMPSLAHFSAKVCLTNTLLAAKIMFDTDVAAVETAFIAETFKNATSSLALRARRPLSSKTSEGVSYPDNSSALHQAFGIGRKIGMKASAERVATLTRHTRNIFIIPLASY